MTREIKAILMVIFVIIIWQVATYLYEFVNPWIGIIALVVMILGFGQFIGLIRLQKITKLFKDDEAI